MSRQATVPKALTLSFVLILIALVSSSWILFRNLGELRSQEQWVRHTYDVIARLEELFAATLDAESGERAYLILRDERALDRVQISSTLAEAKLAEVESLVKDNPEQSREIELLKSDLEKRLDLIRKATSTDPARSQKNVDSEYLMNESRRAMSALRDRLTRLEKREQELLNHRTLSAVKSADLLTTTLVAVAIFNIISAIAVYILLRRHFSRQQLERLRDQRDVWLKAGEADVTKIAIDNESMRPLAQSVLRHITNTLKAPAGNLFSASDGSLELVAGYASDDFKTRERSSQTSFGKGLLGDALRADDLMEISSVPDDYFHLQSSLGSAAPTNLIFMPLRFQNQPVGLIEIASFAALTEDQKEWLRRISGNLGTALNAVGNRERLQMLLEETQRQAEELQTQQEELRTSNEELESQAKALLSTQERMQTQQEELRQSNEELEQQSRFQEEQQEILARRNSDLEAAKKLIETKALELERTNQYKSEFLAKMSHELRTPLNSLMILATLLQENKQGNLTPQQIDFARTIHGAGVDLLSLINDILDLSKLEARRLTARPDDFSLRALFEELLMAFRPMAEQKGLEVRLHIEESVPDRIFTDRQRLQQILRNFLSNALKFTERGEIHLTASPGASRDEIKLTVQDTGIGIPDEKKQLIFEAFEQVDGSVSRKYGGTGLGLTISRELAHLLGGQIDVESKLGSGSRFTLEIPMSLSSSTERATSIERVAAAPVPMRTETVNETRAESPPAHSPSAASRALSGLDLQKKSILIVEDEEVFRKSAAEAARAQGFETIEAGDAETALEILKQHSPEAIMLDVKLPGLSGMTLLEEIKNMPNLRHIPVHMISGMDFQKNALRMGAVGYLGKPVTMTGMRSALERIEHVISQKVKRLLIVEDDPTQRKAITELIKGQDTEITSVESGSEALPLIRSGRFDCVILDLNLKDMNGLDLLEKLHDEQRLTLPPIIVYTGKDLDKDEVDRLQRYSDSIIIKGAKSPERLLDEVSLFLHRIEKSLPEEKRAMLADLRHRDRSFEGRSILVVDDDLRNVFALTSALESKGFKVKAARDGEEALETLAKLPRVDAVLMDIMMPRMDGFEAMKRIRTMKKFKTLPIIALTAKTMKGEHERCLQAGASDYLPKPIHLMNLLSVIKAWLPQSEINL